MVLITGADGFIGRRLALALSADGEPCRLLTRTGAPDAGRRVADLADQKALADACAGIESVFHCAGYAHAFSSRLADDAARHAQVNFEGTRNLLEAAVRAGVRRLVFLSSVKAMADAGATCAGEDFPGEPGTAYGQSKRAAEAAVLAAGRAHGMHVVNLRLAMVYGAGGQGNLERMARLVGQNRFPPLPETANHRSLVHVDDVVSAVRRVANSDAANGQTYIVTGPESPSGRGLFDALRAAHGLPPSKWTVPEGVLRQAARLGDGLERFSGRSMPLDSEVVDRLLGSAWYSPARIEREVGWRARVSLAEGLAEMLKK